MDLICPRPDMGSSSSGTYQEFVPPVSSGSCISFHGEDRSLGRERSYARVWSYSCNENLRDAIMLELYGICRLRWPECSGSIARGEFPQQISPGTQGAGRQYNFLVLLLQTFCFSFPGSDASDSKHVAFCHVLLGVFLSTVWDSLDHV